MGKFGKYYMHDWYARKRDTTVSRLTLLHQPAFRDPACCRAEASIAEERGAVQVGVLWFDTSHH